MKEIIIHAKDLNGVPTDVTISYDLLDITWDRDKGTLTLKPKSCFEDCSQLPVEFTTEEYIGVTEIGKEIFSKPMVPDSPAVEGCMIPQIRKITPRSILREEEEGQS